MGIKLEDMKNKAKEGTDSLEKAKEIGNKALEDARSMSEIINSLPEDVDDEVLQAAQNIRESSRMEAEQYMESDVKDELDKGKNVLDDSNEIGRDQIKNNEAVLNAFEKMDNIGDFGSNARVDGARQVNDSTGKFNDVISDNNTSANNAEDLFKQQKSEISDLF